MHTLTYRPATEDEAAAWLAGHKHQIPGARETEHGLEVPTLPERFGFDGDNSEPIMGADKRQYRANIEDSMFPDAPDYEGAYPVYAVSHRFGWRLESEPKIGDDSTVSDGLNNHLPVIFQHFADLTQGDPWETVDRFLRIFHGGSAVVWDYGGDKYLAYDTRAMRESWGMTGERLETSAPDFGDWKPYVEGEVYWIRVEVWDAAAEEWVGCDNGGDAAGTGDIFGREYAEEGALDLLLGVLIDAEVEVGQTQLPLEWAR